MNDGSFFVLCLFSYKEKSEGGGTRIDSSSDPVPPSPRSIIARFGSISRIAIHGMRHLIYVIWAVD